MKELLKELKSLANLKQAKLLQKFFKTKEGGYGEGDIFLGIKVPIQRKIIQKYDLNFESLQELLDSKIHEHRFGALLMLMEKYRKSENKKEIFDFYLKNTKRINNWDLVDVSAPRIVGNFLKGRDKSVLYTLAESKNLWEKRISIVSTFAFIQENQFEDSIKIAELLLKDKHDLIHKAVGWMLREIGKRDIAQLESFLKAHYKRMPRTMLRYSIEKFPENERKKYLNGTK